MTIDLWMLVGAAALQWVLIMADATLFIMANGVPTASGNRDGDLAEPSPLNARLKRCSENMQENLPMFAILVLVAHVSGQADSLSALGAEVFLAARIVHAGVYAVGVTYLRTAVWSVSIVGMAMIAVSLF